MALSLSFCRLPDTMQSFSSTAQLFTTASSSLSPFPLFPLSPSCPLPMTLHKLRAIQVALVMLIGLAMAYVYPASRVWALIRGKQWPAHASCSKRHKYRLSAVYVVVLRTGSLCVKLSLISFFADKKKRVKFSSWLCI